MAKIDYKEVLLKPIFKGNPVTVLVLGICSSLAVTVQLEGALVMGISVTIVTGLSSFVVSLMRNSIPNRIRIIVQLAESIYVQYKQGAVGICRTYHHELYRDGAYRSIRSGEQAYSVAP